MQMETLNAGGSRIAPAKSTVATIALADAESDVVRHVIHAWRKWCGFSAMPERPKIVPRDLGPALSHISLVRVIDHSDYEFSIVGDAHVEAYGSYQGRRVSDVIDAAPRFGRQLKASYDLVRDTGRPICFRGAIGHDVPDTRFEWFETAYLPIGSAGTGVDHILNAAIYSICP
jgi:hypothetical protein